MIHLTSEWFRQWHERRERQRMELSCDRYRECLDTLKSDSPWQNTYEWNGMLVFDLPSWHCFHRFLIETIAYYDAYIYRGHRDEKWRLLSSFDRCTGELSQEIRSEVLAHHVEDFKKRALDAGIRGAEPSLSQDQWWALGQHHRLLTPLIDWTCSPFVAAFFAFRDCHKGEKRAIFAVSQIEVFRQGGALRLSAAVTRHNERMRRQAGLHTQTTYQTVLDLEALIESRPTSIDTWVLIKMLIPNKCRKCCLRDLRLMNIIPINLFPEDDQGNDLERIACKSNKTLYRLLRTLPKCT